MTDVQALEASAGPISQASHRAGDPVRRLRHAAVAGVAGEFPKQLWPLLSDADACSRTPCCAASGPGFAAPDRGVQPGTPVPDRRAVARGRHRQRPHRAGTGGPQQRPGHRRRRRAGGRGRPGRGAVDDGGGRLDRRRRRAAGGAAHGRGGGARGQGRHLRHAADRAGNRLRLYRDRRASWPARRACTRSPASWRSRTPRPPPPGRRRPASVELRHVRVHRRARCCARWQSMRRRCWRRCATRSPAARTDLDFIRLAAEPFCACPSISLDYAVAERTTRAAVVPADLGWSDVGSWSALWELGAQGRRRQRRDRRRGAGGVAQIAMCAATAC